MGASEIKVGDSYRVTPTRKKEIEQAAKIFGSKTAVIEAGLALLLDGAIKPRTWKRLKTMSAALSMDVDSLIHSLLERYRSELHRRPPAR